MLLNTKKPFFSKKIFIFVGRKANPFLRIKKITAYDAQTLLKDVAQMPLPEIERFVQSVNALITQRKSTDKTYQDCLLLRKVFYLEKK